jgi:hypothetical protein
VYSLIDFTLFQIKGKKLEEKKEKQEVGENGRKTRRT